MELGFGYKIVQITGGYDLHEPITVIDKKTKKKKTGFRIHHYGVLYQALIGFLRHSQDDPRDLDALKERVETIIQKLRDLEAQLKDEFSVEIRWSKP